MNIKPSLTTRKLKPENQESPLSFLETDIMTERTFYRRNHFSYPNLTSANYWIPVNGWVDSPHLFSLHQLKNIPAKTLKVVLECSGNKRAFFKPKVFGEQWEKGAISQGYWKGISLRALLELTGVKKGAREVVFEGYDFGKRTDTNEVTSFTRSLPIEVALHPDTILTYEYNGQPIPFKHGYPLRLIVPKWYAMASVKWIKQITVIPSSFEGPFQTVDYMYYPHHDSNHNADPVTSMNINSTIQKPLDREILTTGIHMVKGIAWTGKGYITKVEVSTDHGQSWVEATLQNHKHPYQWTSWSYSWNASKTGEYSILSKATDSHNRTQPPTPFWNRKGYGYNAIDHITIKIE